MAPDDLASEERLRTSFLAHAIAAELYDQSARHADVVAEALLGRQIGRCEIVDRTPTHCIFRAELNEGSGPLCTLDYVGTLTGTALAADGEPPALTDLRSDATGSAGGSQSQARIRALVHRFFSLVEDPARKSLPFHPLLADRFSLALVEPPIDTLAGVDSWVRERLASVIASEHVLHEVAIEERDCGLSQVRITMKSQALFPDGSGAISRNTQLWKVRDLPDDQRAQIEEITIDRDGVIFFGPPPDYAIRQSPIA